MAVTCDPEHKFDLAIQLGDLKIAYELAKEAEVSDQFRSKKPDFSEHLISKAYWGLGTWEAQHVAV